MESVIKSTFPVQGMSCAACAGSVESMLKSTEGVINAAVNYANHTAFVEYSSRITNPDTLRKSVQSVGYDLLVESVNNVQDAMEKMQAEHLKKVQRQTIGSIILSIPVAVIGMFFMDMPYGNYIMMVLSVPVVFGFGFHFFENAWKKARHGQANMDTLVAVSTGIAFIFSLFNTFYPEFWHQRGLHPHVYYEAAAVVIAFVVLGKWLEEKAKSGTSTAIRKLIGLQSKTVRVLNTKGVEEEIDIALVKVGDTVLAKPGDKIAVDGTVSEGGSFVDESSITGEPVPAAKGKGDKVFAGTINQQGVIRYTADKVGNETVIAQIIKMVQEAQGSKAPVQKLVDKIAGIFVPIVMGIAVLTFAVWMVFGGENAFSHGLLAAVTVLVIACPCALGLATPTAIMVGIGKGAEQNILIKDAESLELAHKVNAIILDKTGTITEGKPEVHAIKWLKEDPEFKNILYTIEAASSHPLAQAVVSHLMKEKPKGIVHGDYENIPGKGIKMQAGQEVYYVGNGKLIQENGIPISTEVSKQVNIWNNEARTVVYFGTSKEILAVIAISDKIKEHSAHAIAELKNLGIEVYMLTGDNAHTAKAVAKQTGIEHYEADVLPSQKADFVKKLQAQGKIVAMIGDGINDSHALAQADVSIAMGKGSDIAIDVAKMTLLTSDLMVVPKALKLSGKTVRAIRQNLFWAFIYNLIGIPIAAGVLYPAFGFMLNPMIASAAMALSSVSVVSNSLRLKFAKI